MLKIGDVLYYHSANHWQKVTIERVTKTRAITTAGVVLKQCATTDQYTTAVGSSGFFKTFYYVATSELDEKWAHQEDVSSKRRSELHDRRRTAGEG